MPSQLRPPALLQASCSAQLSKRKGGPISIRIRKQRLMPGSEKQKRTIDLRIREAEKNDLYQDQRITEERLTSVQERTTLRTAVIVSAILAEPLQRRASNIIIYVVFGSAVKTGRKGGVDHVQEQGEIGGCTKRKKSKREIHTSDGRSCVGVMMQPTPTPPVQELLLFRCTGWRFHRRRWCQEADRVPLSPVPIFLVPSGMCGMRCCESCRLPLPPFSLLLQPWFLPYFSSSLLRRYQNHGHTRRAWKGAVKAWLCLCDFQL